MPCYHPLEAGRSKLPDPTTGKHIIKFATRNPGQYEQIMLPCGRCRGCRHERARQWAVRCVHEANMYENNCFITLTFDEKHLNSTASLDKADFKKFMKRLRKHFYGNGKSDVRYFHCGEYGEQFSRPHHHACLFNFTFPDLTHWQDKGGSHLYRSKTLELLWPYGHSTIGNVTYDSAAYVARYVMKKINGPMAPAHYQGRTPEFTTMSRKPGIGSTWYDRYGQTDVYPRGYIVLNGKRSKIPKYYANKYELTNPIEYENLKTQAREQAKLNPDLQRDRLEDAEQIQYAKDKQIQRSFENQCLESSPSMTKKRKHSFHHSITLTKHSRSAPSAKLSPIPNPQSINTLRTSKSSCSETSTNKQAKSNVWITQNS